MYASTKICQFLIGWWQSSQLDALIPLLCHAPSVIHKLGLERLQWTAKGTSGNIIRLIYQLGCHFDG